MSWAFGIWQEFLKKKACRYILQHYLGQFLKEKLSLDQLSLDLYNGTGTISELNLDVQAINEDLAALNIPVELVDGFVECISVNIPWSALIQDSTKLEVKGLELTLQPKERDDNGMKAGDMFSSMQSSMTTSLQLAKDCLEAEKTDKHKPEPIEGVEKFANMIDSVLSKIKVNLLDTVIRLEHHPEGSPRGVAMEIRIKRMEYFDEMATSSEGTSVDGTQQWEPAAINQKNIHMEGVQLYFDEISTKKASRSRSSSEGSPHQMFLSARSMISDSGDPAMSMRRSSRHSPPSLAGSTYDSQPVQVAVLTGRQELKLKTKQNDTMHGPKLEILCQFGGLHILLSPRQLHGIMELVSGINSPAASDSSQGRAKSSMRNKPMDSTDYQRVEDDLQHQLQSGRIHSNNLASLQDYNFQGDIDDQFYALMSPRQGTSDMDSSFSSNYSAASNRTTSTIPSTTSNQRGRTNSQKDPYAPPKFHEDPSAELSHYQVRVAFFSMTLFHNDPSPCSDDLEKSGVKVMRDLSVKYFQSVGGVTVAGMADLRDIRKQFQRLVSQDNLRILGRPFNIECTQKAALKQISSSLHVTVGVMELVENLYCRRGSDDPVPEVNEILTFHKDGTDSKKSGLYSSMLGGTPCFNMDLTSVSSNKPSSRPGNVPRTDINITLGDLQTELDLTLIDRINTIITPERITMTKPTTGASMYHTAGPYSLAQTLDEGSSTIDQRFTIQVSSSLAKVSFRFPIPDLRQEPHIDKSWYQRNLRDDVLILDLDNAVFRTNFTTNEPLQQVQLECSDIQGYLKFKLDDEPKHFAHITGDSGGEEGFNNPTLTLKFCQNTTSVLDEESCMDDTVTPGDSLNGACQFARTEPSPFSSRRYMHNKEKESDKNDEKTEQMVLPADKEELNEFIQKSVNNTNMVVEIVLPNACLFLPDKNFFEVLYNRLNNDLLLWEPSAPAPVSTNQESMFATSCRVDLNVYNQLLHTGEHFEMAKSGLQYDSDSDTDESINLYSIHDSRSSRRRKSPRQLQSKMCLNLNIGKGRLTAFTQAKDVTGAPKGDKHGEILLQLRDLTVFTVSAHNGDPNLQYVNVLANRVDLYHQACVDNSEQLPIVDCGELSAPVPTHLQHNKCIYRSESGVLVGSPVSDVGHGADSLDMISVALKIKLDTMASKCDLTSDEKVKEFLVSVGVRGATMRHKPALPYQNVFVQLMDFLDVKDYPILGYVDPKVLTELHVHLWTCAIDYRPRYLPMRSVLTADSFSISSNIVAESSISLLRFVLDDGALFLSKKIKMQRTDLRKDFVCVTDVGRLEILLRSNDGKDLRYPKTDLRVSTSLLNLRTCADSFLALIEIIKYIAADGDLQKVNDDNVGSDIHTDIEADISGNTDDGDIDDGPDSIVTQELSPLSTSSLDHVHTLMSDAMMESSQSESSERGSPECSTTDLKQTEVFFVPESLPGADGSSRLQPIVITQNVDSVTSSTMSGVTTFNQEEEEDSDDFCLIDDAAWGKAPKDGEPTIRIFINTPVEIKDNYFSKPVGRTDLLNSPEDFPLAECRYTLKELTVVWYIYGGHDFSDVDCYNTASDRGRTEIDRDSLSVSYHRGSPNDRWSGQAGGRDVPLLPRETLHTRGGPGRDQCKCMELQLTKVKLQHEQYPQNTEQASRQVILISDIEIRDKLKSSKINKFMYQYSSDDMPRQTYANMVHIKALHRRPNPKMPEEECSLKVSLQPIRLNVDQDTLFFIKSFAMDLKGVDDPDTSTNTEVKGHVARTTNITPPPPVMGVAKSEEREATSDPQDLLMQFDELTQDLQASLRGSLRSSGYLGDRGSEKMETSRTSVSSGASATSSGTVTSSTADTTRSSQPVFIKSFVFTPDVPIRLDYHGKFDREHGTLAGLGGLVSLNRSELKLKHLAYKQGLLGTDKLLQYCISEWLSDIKEHQLPNILGGFGPMHAIVTLAHGVKDLFWLPVEQYKKDGRIVRGIQRGASSFSMSTAMSVLELTNRVVQGIQWCAELTFDMVSPGPRKRGYYPRQPADLREGVTNAYIVLREGFSDTANTICDAATKEHGSKGIMGAVGGVLRQIPPSIVQPLIIVPEATSNLIGGLRSQLKPGVKKEDEEKWKEEIID